MLCHCACKHVRLSCVLNKLLTYLLTTYFLCQRRRQRSTAAGPTTGRDDAIQRDKCYRHGGAISAVYRLLWRLFDCPAHWRRPCDVQPFSILWKLRRCCCCNGQRLSTVPYTHNYRSSSVWLVSHFLRTYWLLDFLTWLTLLFYVHFNFLQF